VKCSSYRTDALNMHRYFVDWLKEFLELAKLILVVFCKEVIIIGCTRDRNVERGTKGFRVKKTSLSSTLVKLRYN
jgi:hypothetical protein